MNECECKTEKIKNLIIAAQAMIDKIDDPDEGFHIAFLEPYENLKLALKNLEE